MGHTIGLRSVPETLAIFTVDLMSYDGTILADALVEYSTHSSPMLITAKCQSDAREL